MDENRLYGDTELFTVRVWEENVGNAVTPEREWRGQVRHVNSGTVRYFRDWPALIGLMEELAAGPEGGSPAIATT